MHYNLVLVCKVHTRPKRAPEQGVREKPQDRTTRLRGPLKSEPRFSFSYSFGRHPTSLQIVHEEAKKSNHHSVQLISSFD
jgi:hypothetical protein